MDKQKIMELLAKAQNEEQAAWTVMKEEEKKLEPFRVSVEAASRKWYECHKLTQAYAALLSTYHENLQS